MRRRTFELAGADCGCQARTGKSTAYTARAGGLPLALADEGGAANVYVDVSRSTSACRNSGGMPEGDAGAARWEETDNGGD